MSMDEFNFRSTSGARLALKGMDAILATTIAARQSTRALPIISIYSEREFNYAALSSFRSILTALVYAHETTGLDC